MNLSHKERLFITLFFTIVMIAVLLWEYSHGGISTHYFFQNDDLPGISNWWGLFIIPLYIWLVSGLIQIDPSKNHLKEKRHLLLRGLILVAVGTLISYFFVTNPASDVPFYATIALLVSAFIIPIYKAEYLLGYVLGTLFIFGAFIPVIAGSILWLICYLCFKGPRKLIHLFIKPTINQKPS